MMHDWGFGYGYGFGIGPIGMLIFAALLVIPFWRISERAGYPGLLGLLIVVPVLNVIFLYYLAFADWPSLRKDQPPRTA
jgi:hypothetical protein